MPPLGPTFLHRPIELPGDAELGRAARWVGDGFASMVPDALRRRLMKPAYVLIAGDEAPHIVARSLFGKTAFVENAQAIEALPAAIAIPADEIFETEINLPGAAHKMLREAVSLRLDDLSPLPPAEIAFAIGEVRAGMNDRITARLAIVRKATLDAARKAASPPVVLIGANPGRDGKFDYVFESAPEAAGARGTVLALIAAFAGFFALLWGADRYLARATEQAAADESAIMELLREEKKVEKRYAGITIPETIDQLTISTQISTLNKSLPEGVILDSISIAPKAAHATGYAPQGLAWPAGVTPTITSTDRPGFVRFSLDLPVEKIP